MKYRQLHVSELEELKPQFVRFLAAQSLPAEDWEKVKATDPARTARLLDQFSEMVFDDVIRRITHMEQRSSHQLLLYACSPNKLYLRGLIADQSLDIDFRQNPTAEQLKAQLRSDQAGIKLVQAERAYRPDREADLFTLLEAGATIASNGELYDLLGQVATT